MQLFASPWLYIIFHYLWWLEVLMCLFLPLPSVYSGHQSILVPPLELESNVSLWLSAVSQYKVRVTFCSYSVMEMCTKGLGTQTDMLRVSEFNCSTRWRTIARTLGRLKKTTKKREIINPCPLPTPHSSPTSGRSHWFSSLCASEVLNWKIMSSSYKLQLHAYTPIYVWGNVLTEV